ncbi:MAG: hypothetical protein ACYDCL_01235 [Myxococcales bacterium]
MAKPRNAPPSTGLRALRRRLRASRRVGELELASQACANILERQPGDRRALLLQAWLAERRGDSQAVDGYLAELEERAAALGLLRERNRLALRRASLRDNLGAPARALFERALELAVASSDGRAVFRARRALLEIAVRGDEAAEISAALEALVTAGGEAGSVAEALAAVSALAAHAGAAAVPAARLLASRALANGETEVAASWLRELLRLQPEDGAAARALEQLLLTAARWMDLADMYAQQASRLEGAERAERLLRLAELLEDELELPSEAARTWGAAAGAGLGADALREQIRLHRELGDAASSRRSLDEAVERAGPAGDALVELLLLRARWRRSQGDRTGAAEDLERLLRSAPGSWPALRERAELKAEAADPAGARALELALERPGVPAAERLASYRCLARLYEGPLKRPAEAKRAWEQVLRDDPQARDPPAAERSQP